MQCGHSKRAEGWLASGFRAVATCRHVVMLMKLHMMMVHVMMMHILHLLVMMLVLVLVLIVMVTYSFMPYIPHRM